MTYRDVAEWLRISTLLEILVAGGRLCLAAESGVISTLLEILGLVWLVVVGF